MITVDYFKRLTKKNRPYRCNSCGVKSIWTPEKRLKAAQITKKLWENEDFRRTVVCNSRIGLALSDHQGAEKLKEYYQKKKFEGK